MASRVLTVARRAAVTVVAPLTRGFRVAAVLGAKAEVVSTKKTKKDASLASILDKELQYEKEDNNTEATLKEVVDGLEGWTIANESGTSRFQVSRKVSITASFSTFGPLYSVFLDLLGVMYCNIAETLALVSKSAAVVLQTVYTLTRINASRRWR
jgi:hypothetical protein